MYSAPVCTLQVEYSFIQSDFKFQKLVVDGTDFTGETTLQYG